MNPKVKRLSEIEAKPILRLSTGFDDLDWIYGYSQFPGEIVWGMPIGKISLWSGTSGIGKSRLCIEVAKKQSILQTKILYFQTESTLEDFASWAKDTNDYSNIYCSGENKIDEIIKIIYEIRPNVVFIDSVNEIEEFENGNKQEARRIISGADGRPGLRQVVNDTDCHIILLGQLNQDGKTIKGGTSLPHLVDIALDLVPAYVDDELREDRFIVDVGVKHRYGKKGPYTVFQHGDEGVEQWIPMRYDDEMWCKAHGRKTASQIQSESKALPPSPPKRGYNPDGTLIEGYNPDGTLDQNSPRYRAAVLAFSKTPEGKAIMKEAKKRKQGDLYDRIGDFFDSIFNRR